MAYFLKGYNPKPVFKDEGTINNTPSGAPPTSHTHPVMQINDATTVGQNLVKAPDPSAIRFLRINADNTVSELTDSQFRTAIGAGTSGLVLGTTAGTACEGNDARLSDARTPTAHTQAISTISDSTTLGQNLVKAANPGAIRFFRINADNSISELSDSDFRAAIGAGVSNLVIGTTAGTACEGNDARLSDARTPTAHQLDGALHTVSELTPGHFLKALTATTFGIVAHGLTAADVGALSQAIGTDTHFTSGFLNRTTSTLSLSTRTLSIAPTSGTFYIYLDGIKIAKTGGASCSTTIPATVGLHFIYFDATGTLQNSMTPWVITAGLAPVATIYWNGTAGAVSDERHLAQRNLSWHQWAHDTIGCRYESGLVQTFPTGAQSKIQIEAGVIHDEDIEYVIAQQKICRLWYETGASAWTWANAVDNAGNDRPYLWNAGTSRIQYPKSDSAYALTDVGATDYLVIWVYATTDVDRPIYIIIPSLTAAYNTVANARAAAAPITAGILTPEMKVIYRWIFKGDGTYQEGVDYRASSSVPSGGSAAVSALGVTYTPTGTIAASNVQNAIDELDTEKAAVNASTTGSAGSLKSTATTGLMTITGPAAGATRIVTVPDANCTMARADAAQTLNDFQTFKGANDKTASESVGKWTSNDGSGAFELVISRGSNSSGYWALQAVEQTVGYKNISLNPSGGFVGINTAVPKAPLHVVGLPQYANNASAITGGLSAGAFYRTGGDPDSLCVVH
jgi:hypothetical protein